MRQMEHRMKHKKNALIGQWLNFFSFVETQEKRVKRSEEVIEKYRLNEYDRAIEYEIPCTKHTASVFRSYALSGLT